MKSFQARQGDVFIQRIDTEIPSNAKRVKADKGRTILAYGEVTGHAHALPLQAKLFRMDEPSSGTAPPAYLVIEGKTMQLRHEEHAPISLPPGNYKITVQREYHPEALRNVAD
jgi:hypothetical protein